MKRRRLGQHYLVDPQVVHRVVELAEIKPADRVLEIGTGKGVLTTELLGRGASLTGYEVDRENYEATLKTVGERCQLVNADAFDHRPEFDVLVSSLPYSESANFVKWLSGITFRKAVVVLQDDFVEKITAPPGDREYRGVSALAQIAFTINVQMRIRRSAFSPQPRVDSMVVSFLPRQRVSATESANIMKLFSLRRRQVASTLAELKMKSGDDYGTRRVYTLRPEEVHSICRPYSPVTALSTP